jgi:hypothetical protein
MMAGIEKAKGTFALSRILLLVVGALVTGCRSVPATIIPTAPASAVAPTESLTPEASAIPSPAATATPTNIPSPTPTVPSQPAGNPYGQVSKIESPDKRWTAVLDTRVGSLELVRADGQSFLVFPAGSTAGKASWSPDSRQLLIVRTNYVLPPSDSNSGVLPGGPVQVWSMRVGTDKPGTPSVLYHTPDSCANCWPPQQIDLGQWSPDSRYILFWAGMLSASLQADGMPLDVLDTETGKVTRAEEESLLNPHYQSWAPDSSKLAVTAGGSRSAQENKWLDVVDMETGKATTVVSKTEQIPGIVAWSPRGNWIAYAAIRTSDTSRDLAYWMSFENPAILARRIYLLDWKTGQHWQLNSANTFQDAPTWSADGKTLYYVQREGDAMVLMAADPATGRAQAIPGAQQPVPSGVGYYGQSQWNDLLEYRPEAPHVPVPALAQEYLDAMMDLSLRYPAGWTVGNGWETLLYRCGQCITISPSAGMPEPSELGRFSGRVFVSIETVRNGSPDLDELLSDEPDKPGPGQYVGHGSRLHAFEQSKTTIAGRSALRVETIDGAGVINHMLIILDGDRALVLRGQGDDRVFDAIAATVKLALPSAPAPRSALAPASEWPIYRHPMGVEVRYPPGWRVDSTGMFVHFCDGPAAGQCFDIVNHSGLKQPSDFPIEVGSQVAMTKTLTLDGQPAVFVQIRDSSSFEGYTSVVAVVTPYGRGLTIGNRTDAALFEQVLRSIRFFRSEWP